MPITIPRENILAAILGHAVADALGVPVEFSMRSTRVEDPVTDMRGHGTYDMPAGTWSDDTSMTLATLDSLTNGFDPEDMMARFDSWLTDAAYTATYDVFDIGNTTYNAISNYRQGIDPLRCGIDADSHNGNGSLMRCIPTALYCYSRMADAPLKDRMEVIHQSSALTHGHPLSRMCCGVYSFVLWRLLENPSKEAVREGLRQAQSYYSGLRGFQRASAFCARVCDPDFSALPEDEIYSSGYVVYTLEAAIWCLLNTDSYREAVLRAVNLGSDTDTVAAVTGGLAGLLYGLDAIPQQWLDTLRRRGYIEQLCNAFADAQQ